MQKIPVGHEEAMHTKTCNLLPVGHKYLKPVPVQIPIGHKEATHTETCNLLSVGHKYFYVMDYISSVAREVTSGGTRPGAQALGLINILYSAI